ncbi:hypothetical protein KEJ44_07795 [Candidatus Bathyarchaeota archaeon]|nr:hypothetical protein [Candidatus Bathyarchaeota archaeon]
MTHIVGVDLGKKRDYTVIAVLKEFEAVWRLVFLKRFKLGTAYASVIGYLKVLCEKMPDVAKIVVDQTGAEYFVEDLARVVRAPVEGVMLSQPRKEEVMGNLKKMMQEGRLKIPYDEDLIAELNVERYELTKAGKIQFSHPEGSHDDRLWALALAAYGTRREPDRSKPISISFG